MILYVHIVKSLTVILLLLLIEGIIKCSNLINSLGFIFPKTYNIFPVICKNAILHPFSLKILRNLINLRFFLNFFIIFKLRERFYLMSSHKMQKSPAFAELNCSYVNIISQDNCGGRGFVVE